MIEAYTIQWLYCLPASHFLLLSQQHQSKRHAGEGLIHSCLKRQLRWEVQGWHHRWSVLKSNALSPKRSKHLCSRTAVSVQAVSNWHLLPWLLLTRKFLIEKISRNLPRAQWQFVLLWIDLILSRWDKRLMCWITKCRPRGHEYMVEVQYDPLQEKKHHFFVISHCKLNIKNKKQKTCLSTQP